MTIPRNPSDITPAWLGSVLDTDVTEVGVTAIGTGQTGATYRVTATYSPDAQSPTPPRTFAVKLPAQDDAVRERVALGYLSEVEFYSTVINDVAIPVPGCFHCDLLGWNRFRSCGGRHGARRAGRSDRRMDAGGGGAGYRGAGWAAWPQLGDRRFFDLASIVMPKPGDEAAAKGMGEVTVMAADITLEKLGDRVSDEDRETLTTSMSLVAPWLLAVPDRFR